MIARLIPWKLFLQRAAHHYGFIDPVSLMARMHKFSQPSEVQEPIELLRAGVIFHSRGLLNTKAIQTNLDWVWPYWVERQFNPADPSFIPRAFSFSHINLTHRNWTAVGHPEIPLYPIVDPRGLVTPLYDGWSVDVWLETTDGHWLLPSKSDKAQQRLLTEDNLTVVTTFDNDSCYLQSTVKLRVDNDTPVLCIEAEGQAARGGKIIVAVRPYNPEGIQFIEEARLHESAQGLLINGSTEVLFGNPPDSVHFSNYEHGDVIHQLTDPQDQPSISCRAGMATAAATFKLPGNKKRSLEIRVPLERELKQEISQPADYTLNWVASLKGTAKLSVPDSQIQFLYDAAMRTLHLLSAHQIVPGPYTYFRFWFRDACLMLNALLTMGADQRVLRLLKQFPQQQKRSGYFQSQDGEWDSNGQVLWIFNRYEALSGKLLPDELFRTVDKAASWIDRKRLPAKLKQAHAGLLPAGFSAEHFGPNDYYYWDDYWGIAGFQGAAAMHRRRGNQGKAKRWLEKAAEFTLAVNQSIDNLQERRTQGGIPASPYRRMDSGAIGSLVADYPLQLVAADDQRIAATTKFLISKSFCNGAFFQDMIHSGINVYLTLDIAQTLLRHGDPHYRRLIKTVADLATPTGQWPEAIHPATGGGCMGDGQHGWAAAEWLMMIRNLFVREEGEQLIIGSGIFPHWLHADAGLSFGPTLTPWGSVQVDICGKTDEKHITVTGQWFDKPPKMLIALPGMLPLQSNDSVHRKPLYWADKE